MRKKPDRKLVAATLAFVAGAASMAIGQPAARPAPEVSGLQTEAQADRVMVRLPRLDEKRFPSTFVVTGGS